MLRQGITLTRLGIAIELIGAAIASRALVTLVFGVTPLDSATDAGVTTLLMIGSMIACALPARRASASVSDGESRITPTANAWPGKAEVTRRDLLEEVDGGPAARDNCG